MLSLSISQRPLSNRDAWLEIDLAKLEQNVQVIKSWLAPESSSVTDDDDQQSDRRARLSEEARRRRPLLLGTVKADGYGHGASAVAEILQKAGASFLAVATVDEGISLRKNGINLPILVFAPMPIDAIPMALEHSLDLAITHPAHLTDVVSASRGKFARVHLKVDSGMHRLGIPIAKLEQVVGQIEDEPRLQLVSVFSHLAKAADLETTTKQNERFLDAKHRVGRLLKEPVLYHLASSAAARRYRFAHHDMVRIGLSLYGLESQSEATDLLPIMSIKGRITQLLDIDAGEPVGYGHTWQATRPSRLASIQIGYADGVDRGLSNRIEGSLHGQVVPQVGLISMDQMILDVTSVPGAQVGDVITLVGAERGSDGEFLSLGLWAKKLDTITYEMAVRMALRLPRKFVGSAGLASA